MYACKQADTAVGWRSVVQAKLAMGYIDEHLLEQVGEHRVGDPFAQHQAHQRAHDTPQRTQHRRG